MRINIIAPKKAGHRMLQGLAVESPHAVRRIAVQYRRALPASLPPDVVRLPLQSFWSGGDGNGIDYIMACQNAEAQLARYLSDAEVNMIIGGFSARECAFSYLAQLSAQCEVPSVVIAGIPMQFEGSKSRKAAIRHAAACPADCTIAFDGEYYLRQFRFLSPRLGMDDCFSSLDSVAHSFIEKLFFCQTPETLLSAAEQIKAQEAPKIILYRGKQQL